MATKKNSPQKTSPKVDVFMLAGEPSGDLIGADIMRRLKALRPVDVRGVGGEAMMGEGLSPIFDMRELSVMGFADVMRQLPRLLKRVKSTAAHICQHKPDIVVLVDYQEFSTLLAKRLRKEGYPGPIILCVAPSVWAWRPGRAPKLKGVFDEILALFPFEPEVMARLGGPETHYIGHPASGRLPQVGSIPERGSLMLLPGSRRGEIKRHMKLFQRIAGRLKNHPKITNIVLPTVPAVADMVGELVGDWPMDVEIVLGQDAPEALYAQTRIALASSGTVTLEMALRGVPFVGTYVPDALLAVSYLIAGRPRVLLPNVIAGEVIVPEELYGPRMSQRIETAMLRLLDDADAQRAQIAGFDRVRDILLHGTADAKKEDAGVRILSHLT